MADRIREWLGELPQPRTIWRPLLAELLGTALLVLLSCGSTLTWNGTPATVTQIALCFGLTVASLAQAIGHVSGCHINPAVTAGLLTTRGIGLITGILYIIAQSVGGILGALILKAVTPEKVNAEALGVTKLAPDVDPGLGIGIELIITFVLVLTVFGVTDPRRSDLKGSAPLAIGLAVAAGHLFAIPATGSSMNPARSLGPAVIQGEWDHHWVYWVGPILGGVIAGLIYNYVFRAGVLDSSQEKDDYKLCAKAEQTGEKDVVTDCTTSI